MTIDLSSVRPDLSVGFVADRLPSGYGHTWTLTTLLGTLLSEAETRYGQRDLTWTPLGIEFIGDNPQIWYPGGGRNISICLSASASRDFHHAAFQLAHEVIHLLAPAGSKKALVIEEGLATLFSDEMAAFCGSTYRTSDQNYLRSAAATRKLLAINSNSIRELRNHRTYFNDFDAEFLRSVIPGLGADLAAELCQPHDPAG